MSLSDEMLAAGRKPKLADLVIGTLRKRINAGEYRAGAKLPTES
jgi:GntR family transcriptional regulator, transcriptional repressor for pyruvate dehydrogenase complex